MSLNWKEINLILEELDLAGAQIQEARQSTFNMIIFRVHKKGETKHLLVSLCSGSCRFHETFSSFPKSEKPLRFAQFLNSKIVNGYIHEALQLGDNRIVRLIVKRGQTAYKLYIRLWSNAANFIVTDEKGTVLDAMRRLPKRGEITGASFKPENMEKKENQAREFEIRDIEGDGSFNKKIDSFYSVQAGPLSLETLREQARRYCEGSIGRISAALENLREKQSSFENAGQFKKYGDLILSNISKIKLDDKWLEVQAADVIRIRLEPGTKPQDMAGKYYEQYKKAKNGLAEIQREIAAGEQELKEVTEKLNRLLEENNPLVLAKLLSKGQFPKQSGARARAARSKKEKARPGLAFKRGDWLIIVGRDASENDELLRRHVKGNDLWLHARDYHGSYVFIKQRSGKTVPLEILLDAGTLAIFYSKGRNNGEGDLFYTQAKYLRRVKDGPKGLVIPAQEKNLHVKIDAARLRSLENCKVVD
ncbi:MAG: NFACT RNA binding domain-containing protein [Treponema sp.]|jgi:predicted ribosome quality control (RQC) complex YloA/Tae2 family protein|nr:NFACT RNA binding domain-containing protein [Treponema sp.]